MTFTWLPEFQVNAGSLAAGVQRHARAVEIDGGLFTGWQDGSNAIVNAPFDDIVGVRQGLTGNELSRVLVNQRTSSEFEEGLALAPLADGGFFAVYQYFDTEVRLEYARFNAAGGLVHTATLAFGDTGTSYSDATVALLDDGNVAISFLGETTGLVTETRGIFGRIFSPATNTLSALFAISDGDQAPSTAAISGNRYAVAYVAEDTFESDLDLSIRNASGSLISTLTVDADQDATGGVVSGLSTGGFVVAWTRTDLGGGDVLARMYDANGAATGPASISVGAGASAQRAMDVVGLRYGGFYTVHYDATASRLVGTLFDAAGVRVGIADTFVVAPSTLGAVSADLVATEDGRIVLTWMSADDIREVILDPRTGTLFEGDASDNNLTARRLFDTTLRGQGGDDYLLGLEGNDVLDGGAGADVMQGGTGNDTYYIDNAGDAITEVAGAGTQDTVIGTAAIRLDLLAAAQGIEHLALQGSANIAAVGTATFNTIAGNFGANYLAGLGGNDTISGGFGSDTVFGGEGKDTLTGGGGNDRFYYAFIADSGGTQPRRDVITEFGQDFRALNGDDWIDLAATDANGALAGNQAFVWLATGAFTGAAGELRYFQDVANNRTIIEGNVRVDAASPGAEFSIELTGLYTLTAGATSAFDIIL